MAFMPPVIIGKKCPDCDDVLVKTRIQYEDLSGWFSAWTCGCQGDQEYDLYIWSKNNEQVPRVAPE